VYEKRLFGTQAALNAANATGITPNKIIGIKPSVPIVEEESKEYESTAEPVVAIEPVSTEGTGITQSAEIEATIPIAISQPIAVRRPAIDIKPAAAPVIKPATGSFSFASKTPLKTSFTLAKPNIASQPK